MTDSELKLWQTIRRKQILDVQFYRQKPIGPYIVDFYSSSPKIAIELDGSQHYLPEQIEKDKNRDKYLTLLNITILRFDNSQIMQNCDAVLQIIMDTIYKTKNPPARYAHDPLFQSG